MRDFGVKGGIFVEETRDFYLKSCIFGGKKRDFGVKCSSFELNIHDSRAKNGIFMVKMRVLGVKFSKRKCLLFGRKVTFLRCKCVISGQNIGIFG